MKKVLLITALAVFSFTTVNAQEDKKEFKEEVNEVVEMAKEGGFYVGANIGLPLAGVTEVASFNIGFDAAYLFEVIPNLEVGALIGYSHFFGNGNYTYSDDDGSVTLDYKDASFLPIAASGRYYFNEHQFFAGVDTGYAINLSGDDVDGGFYFRPKFGYNLGAVTLIGSFTSISGGSNYNSNLNAASVSGFNTANVGIEFGF